MESDRQPSSCESLKEKGLLWVVTGGDWGSRVGLRSTSHLRRVSSFALEEETWQVNVGCERQQGLMRQTWSETFIQALTVCVVRG